MRIYLRGRDVRVSEHFLDAHDFGAVFEQVRGKAVTKHVRARLAFPADIAEQVVDVVSERADAEWFAFFAEEYVARDAWGVSRFDFCDFKPFQPCC